MSKYEDVYMKCPFCGREILKSATVKAIKKWVQFHITERGCMK